MYNKTELQFSETTQINGDGAFLKLTPKGIGTPLRYAIGKFANPLSTAREWDKESNQYHLRGRDYTAGDTEPCLLLGTPAIVTVELLDI